MSPTPAVYQLLRFLRNAARVVAILVVALLLVEFFRIGLLFHRAHPLLAYAFVGIAAIFAIVMAIRLFAFLADRKTLKAPWMPGTAWDFRDYKAQCKYLVAVLKRMSRLDHLDSEARKSLRQSAYDVEETLGHHPLREDLARLVEKAEDKYIGEIHDVLRANAHLYIRDRMKSVVEYAVEPPFPVINPFVVLYSQVVMVTRIVDLYVARPALFEYYIVLRDVFRVITEGNFFKLGQRLFEGVYANSPPMGNAIDDLGQALTSIWLTRTVGEAAIQRCEALTPWTSEGAIAELEAQAVPCLTETKECLVNDALPTLRLRIRHSAPIGVQDVAGFSESITSGIAKAVDTVVKVVASQSPETAIATARRTHSDSSPSWASEHHGVVKRVRRRRHSSDSRVFRVFKTFGQRVKYSVMGRPKE